MKTLFHFSANFPRAIILLLVAITLLASTQLSRLQIDVSAQSMMVKNDPLWQRYQQMLDTFGSDSVVMIMLQDQALFSSRKLGLIQQAIVKLEALESVTRSSSLFTVPNIREQGEYVMMDPFLQQIPESEAEAQQIINDAIANPLVANNLISLDGKTMAINLTLDDRSHSSGHDQAVTQAIEEVLEPLKRELETVFQMSSHSVRDEITQQIQQDQYFIMPIALVVLVVVLGLSLRKLNCALVPLSTAVISIVITLSLMAMFGVTVNVLTSIIPALLVIIGSTEDVHLMAEYHDGIRSGLSRQEAVARLSITQSLAILLAFITTFVGLLSVVLNDLELLREFGWVVSVGLLINFIITVLFVPAYLTLFGAQSIASVGRENLYQRLVKAIFSVVIRFKGGALSLLLVVLLYFSWGAQFLQVNNNTISYFSPQSEVRQQADLIHESLSGMQTFSIVLDSGIEGTFLKARYLREVEQLQQLIQQRAVFDKSFSFADFIKLTHQVMDGTEEPMLPEEDDLIEAYMGLVQFSTVEEYVNESFSSSRILVRHNLDSSYELKQEIERIRQFVDKELKSPLKISFTGDSVLTNHAADIMAVGQFQSLILVVVVIFLLVALLFFDLRAGLLALVPNIFPLIVLFGVMGYFELPLDIGTAMVGVIALGICVDDTIHFLSRYHFFTRGTQDVERALMETVAHEATPITTTSVALAMGFLTLTLSSFQPVVHFGALSALVMILALFSNFVLTPILLSYIRLSTVWDMLSLNLKTSVLKQSHFFKGMNDFQIKKVILSGTIHEYADGEVIIEQASRGAGIHVILSGRVKFTHREKKDGTVLTLRSLGAGELFGEVSSLAGERRLSSVSADNYAKVLMIHWHSINELGRFHPRISMKLFQNLSTILSQRVVQQSVENEQVREILADS
ncbi:MAG: MMPL family transporter [Gammaproteobacteria bacterium]|nr:MMPL family transporter [Gammaproteobacteria bacterium]